MFALMTTLKNYSKKYNYNNTKTITTIETTTESTTIRTTQNKVRFTGKIWIRKQKIKFVGKKMSQVQGKSEECDALYIKQG